MLLCQRETTTSGIRALLESALRRDPRPQMVMVYTDAEDNRTERTIIPSGIEERRGVRGFRSGNQDHLIAFDVDKDAPRTFRIDRINSLTEAS